MNARAFVTVLALSWLAADVANAQPSPPPSSDARATADELFSTGQSLMTAGRYEEACAKLAESFRIEAAGGTLLNLALCYVKEGRIASAWSAYRDSIELARRSNRPDRENVARDAMFALEPQLSRLVLRVPEPSRVPGLTIVRGGVELSEPSWGVALPVDPGKVIVEARAPGYVTWTGDVTATSASTVELTVPPLVHEEIPPPPAVVPAIPERPSWLTPRRALSLSLIAVGAASLTAGTFFGVRSLAKRSDSDGQCPTVDGEMRCTVAGSAAMSDAQKYAWFSDVGIGLGAAAAIVGTALLVTSKTPSAQTAGVPSIRIGASPLRGGGAATIGGSW